jgi:hypothetical protein
VVLPATIVDLGSTASLPVFAAPAEPFALFEFGRLSGNLPNLVMDCELELLKAKRIIEHHSVTTPPISETRVQRSRSLQEVALTQHVTSHIPRNYEAVAETETDFVPANSASPVPLTTSAHASPPQSHRPSAISTTGTFTV